MTPRFSRLFGRAFLALGGTSLLFSGTTLFLGSLPAGAAQATVGLGTAGSFAVLGGSEVTNTGASVINGNLGVSPGTAVTGFPPGIVNGTIHSADSAAAQAQADTTTAYNDAAGRTPFTAVATELGGRTLQPGVYRNTTLGLTGTLTLDAAGDPDAVFIFQAGSTLITASGSRVVVINGAQACNVFWKVGSSATLGTTTEFVGTVLALTSITANNNATVHGRLLARNGAVTLDDNTITRSVCSTAVTTTTAPATTTTTAAPTTTTTAAPTTTTTAAPTSTGPTTGTPVESTVPTPTEETAPTAGVGSSTPGLNVPSGGTGGGEPTRSALTPAPGGDSSTTVGRLANTGSGLTPIAAVAGVLAILLGAAMLHGSRATRPSRLG